MNFNLEFIITLVIALFAAYVIHQGSPNLNPLISYFLIPLLIAYLVVKVINNVFPSINQIGRNLYAYGTQKASGEINEWEYLQIYPPIFAVLILFLILLYNRSLG